MSKIELKRFSLYWSEMRQTKDGEWALYKEAAAFQLKLLNLLEKVYYHEQMVESVGNHNEAWNAIISEIGQIISEVK